MDGVCWRDVCGHEDTYEVSSAGDVRNKTTGKILAKSLAGLGYVKATLWINGKREQLYVHRLMAKAFLGEQTGTEVTHKNGVKTDNRIENLAWYSKKHAGDGSERIHAGGYTSVRINGRWRLKHVLIAETALGKPLPKLAGVHHINGDKSDNRSENLLVFPNASYHKLIHLRTDAMNATGDPTKRKCWACGMYDDAKNLSVAGFTNHHKWCPAPNRRKESK